MLNTAIKLFKIMPKATSWLPKQNFKNAIVEFKRVGQDGIEKIVTRKDGKKITGHFVCAQGYKPQLTGVTINTNSGRIAYSYGAQNYDKVIQLMPNSGDSLTRLGHKSRTGFVDTYFDRSKGFYQSGDCTKEFKRIYNQIMNSW